MIRLLQTPFVDDVEILLLVDGNIMRGLPHELVRQTRPGMLHFILVLPLAEDELVGVSFGGENIRNRQRTGSQGGRLQETAAG